MRYWLGLPSQRRARGQVTFVAAVVITACDGHQVPPPAPLRPTPDVHQYVTGEAASALNAKGEFILAAAESPDGAPMISGELAAKMAMAFVRTLGPSFQARWEKERGSPINLATLRPEPRVFFAHTPYEAFRQEGFHPAERRLYGPWYLVTLSSDGVPALAVAVSAFNTDYGVDRYGRLQVPLFYGTDFFHAGIRRDGARRVLTPEEAVERVGREVRARVERTPLLVLRGARFNPLDAGWKLELDRPVPVDQERAGRAAVRALYRVSDGANDWLVPSADQPTVHRDVGLKVGPRGESLGTSPVQVGIRQGFATVFERASVLPGGAP
jgi:hypothetical protein